MVRMLSKSVAVLAAMSAAGASNTVNVTNDTATNFSAESVPGASSSTTAAGDAGARSATNMELTAAFMKFMKDANRNYAAAELAWRFAIYAENYLMIMAANRDSTRSYKLALNKFADLTQEEFASRFLGRHSSSLVARGDVLPDSLNETGDSNSSLGDEVNGSMAYAVNWTARGAVTAVKDQLECGGCWAFSATGALEGAKALATGELPSDLSVQQLLDCAAGTQSAFTSGVPNAGCQGGLEYNAWEYVQKRSLCTAESYPYFAVEGACHAGSLRGGCTVGMPSSLLHGWRRVPTGNPRALLEAVSMQPVSTGVNADGQAMRWYDSGIIEENCSPQLDHSVLIVGFGEEKGLKYWLVKNSWGADWGELGYFRVKRFSGEPGDKPPKGGLCGLLLDATYPIVKAPGRPGPDRRLSAASIIV
eukprot:TRINITY_DN112194_c0_g1_i1.p1 TRINITY_DN112194_c0_g1~~TRINITY_DN112194_c0_g1_i1.p1  ORF type:complete len:420 (+),score=87.86 TRINITY_DN112194_c0_g1_i1:106-1365(+)